MAPKERRFKFRLLGFGFVVILVSGLFLWFLVQSPETFGESTAKFGTVAGLILIGAIFYTAWAIRVKLRQHNVIRW